jgi:hypothetical protein
MQRTGQSTFGMFVSVDPHVLNGEGLRLDWGLEALCTVPGHVLNCYAGAFGYENEVLDAEI